jgi:hypothetical protein
MNKAKLCLIMFAFLLLAGSTIGSAQEKTIMITGRAVDERGKPIPNAIATFYYPPCRDCIDHILPAGFSLHDGVFFVEAAHISGEGLKLFMEDHIPTGFFKPFGSPPFDNLSHVPLFRGIPVYLPKSMRRNYVRVDLGDVLVRIRWSKVIVDLREVLGEQYQSSQDSSRSLKMTLRSSKRKLIYDGRLPEVAFNSTFSSVNLALPKGWWILEFSLNTQNQRMRSIRFLINVKNLGCTKVTLIEGKQRQMPCN